MAQDRSGINIDNQIRDIRWYYYDDMIIRVEYGYPRYMASAYELEAFEKTDYEYSTGWYKHRWQAAYAIQRIIDRVRQGGRLSVRGCLNRDLEQYGDKTFNKKLSDILAEMYQKGCQDRDMNINKAVTDVKMLVEDKRLDNFEQAMVTRRKERLEASPQLTLGELIVELRKVPNKNLLVVFDNHYYPSGLSSWRGSYDELAIEYDSIGSVSLSDFLEMLNSATGKPYEGYKGGRFVMRLDTPLWVANHGICMGFRRGEGGDDYQAVSGVVWNDREVTICTNNQDY